MSQKNIDATDVATLEILTAREAAAYLRTSPATLSYFRARGDGPAFIRQSSRKTLYRKTELDAWLNARTFANTSAEAVA